MEENQIPLDFTKMTPMELQFLGMLLQYENNRRALSAQLASKMKPEESTADSAPPPDAPDEP